MNNNSNNNNNNNNNLLLNGGFDKDNHKNKDVYRLLDSGINRWEPLFFNPQKNCIEPFNRNGINTNLLSLDKHLSECSNK
jgi:hypothetical protein